MPWNPSTGRAASPPQVAALIPALNEQATVAGVVEVVRRLPAVGAVVVVSDGSTDQTADVARAAGALCVELRENVGKGGAIRAGLGHVGQADIFLLLDADLLGLRSQHVEALLQPVLHGTADATVGLFTRGRLATDLAHRLTPWLSGQRALRREVLEGLPFRRAEGFSFEIALTRHLQRIGARVATVPLPGLSHRVKEEKLGFVRGFGRRLAMYGQLLRAALVDRLEAQEEAFTCPGQEEPPGQPADLPGPGVPEAGSW